MIAASFNIDCTEEQTEEKTPQPILFVSKWLREKHLVYNILLSTRHSITHNELLFAKISGIKPCCTRQYFFLPAMGLLLEIAGNVPVAWVLFSHRTGQCHIHSEWLLSLPKCNSLFTLDTISA